MTTLQEACSTFASGARSDALRKLIADPKARRIRLEGLEGSAPAMLFASLGLKRPALIVADDADTAGYMYHDLCQILGQEGVAILTSAYKRDIRYGQIDPPSQILRTETLDAYSSGKARWIVSWPEALAEKVPAPERLEEARLSLKSGTKASMPDTVAKLREEGFRQTDYVYEPGQFAVRGSILDIYSFSHELPYRVDFFDDEIDSIRTFNVETQLSERRLKEITVIPALADDGKANGMSLFDFIDPGTPVFVQSAAWLASRVKAVCSETISEAVLIADEGDPDAMGNLVDPDAFDARLGGFKTIEYGVSGPAAGPQAIPDARMAFDCSPQALYHKNFNLIADSFAGFLAKGYRILILSDSAKEYFCLLASHS